MTANRSVPDASVVPVLAYPDVVEASECEWNRAVAFHRGEIGELILGRIELVADDRILIDPGD